MHHVKTILILLLLTRVCYSGGIEGKWAGALESPGSIAALRLDIATGSDSKLLIDVYDTQHASAITELRINGEDITFKAEVATGQPATFVGKIAADELAGSFSVTLGERTLSGKWKVRRFDYSKLKKNPASTDQSGKNELPSPTGRHKIGRRSFYWTNGERKIYAQLWYPAANRPKAVDAPYIEHLDDKPEFAMLRNLRTHAKADVPLVRSKTAFPVIVFAPGLGASISRYAAVIENLVSHGYAIIAINPAGDAGDYKLPDGTLIPYNRETWDRTVSATWTADQRKAWFDERRHGWAADMSFALDKLKDTFRKELDVENAGALGHSYGGQAVSIACANDTRFKACANLDGLAQGAAFLPNLKGELLKQPFLFFSKTPVATDYELALMNITRAQYDTRDRQRMLELWKPSLKTRLEALSQGTYFAVARGATHASFSDGPLLQSNQSRDVIAERHRLTMDIKRHVLEFFDKFLRKKNTSLLDPDVSVVVELLKKA